MDKISILIDWIENTKPIRINDMDTSRFRITILQTSEDGIASIVGRLTVDKVITPDTLTLEHFSQTL